MTIAARLATGAVLACVVALSARRAGALSGPGATAAASLGLLAVGAGWSWGLMLVAYFLASTLLTRHRAGAKATRTSGVVDKGGARDAWQVVANGGAFGVAALGTIATGDAFWLGAGAGALAASAADTWGTELGVLSARPPRSILSGRVVPPGTSGGVSAMGLAASVAGAAFVGGLALIAGWGVASALAAAAAGVAGALLDSVLGATLQVRRRCPACGTATEQVVHECGATTAVTDGVRWMGNDAVNALSTAAGATIGGGLVRLIG